MNVPNLDSMTQDELWAFYAKYASPNAESIKELLGDLRAGCQVITYRLACYARNKASTMQCRLDGNIQEALMWENAADMVYQYLPDDLKW